MDGDTDLTSGEPRSVRGESPENRSSIFGPPFFSRRGHRRTSPTGALGIFDSRAWLGLGGTFDGWAGGAGTMGTASGDFVPLEVVPWLSDLAGMGRLESVARFAGC